MPRKTRKPDKPKSAPQTRAEALEVVLADAPPILRAWLEWLFAGQRWEGSAPRCDTAFAT